MTISGPGARELFKNEPGGHRVQRVSPTEKRGRVHTSTITVAILELESPHNIELDERDIDIVTTKGSGPGGQARNKIESCVVATHKPTGISVRIDLRSQYQSKSVALQVLKAKVAELHSAQAHNERNKIRKEQVGIGSRGDKIRTYREQDDQVNDHITGKRWKLGQWLKGNW